MEMVDLYLYFYLYHFLFNGPAILFLTHNNQITINYKSFNSHSHLHPQHIYNSGTGADVNAKTLFDQTSLHFAHMRNDDDIARLLLQCKSLID